MTQTQPWQLSATELVALTRSGAMTAEDAVASAVGRMRAVNPGLNAVVVDLGDAAIERARALDLARAAGATPGPLHGVAVTIKINADQRGQASSNGLIPLKDFIAPLEVLGLLALKGKVVTGDALHCNRRTVEAINARGGDWCLG